MHVERRRNAKEGCLHVEIDLGVIIHVSVHMRYPTLFHYSRGAANNLSQDVMLPPSLRANSNTTLVNAPETVTRWNAWKVCCYLSRFVETGLHRNRRSGANGSCLWDQISHWTVPLCKVRVDKSENKAQSAHRNGGRRWCRLTLRSLQNCSLELPYR